MQQEMNRRTSSRQTNRWPSKRMVIITTILAIMACFQAAFFYSWTHSRSATIMPIACTAVTILFIFWAEKKRYDGNFSIERCWLLAASIVGVMYCFLMPPNATSDELYHFERSYYYSDILLLQPAKSNEMTMRASDARLERKMTSDAKKDGGIGLLATLSDYQEVLDDFELTASESDSRIVSVPLDREFTLENNYPQVRLPAAIGIALARLLHLGTYPMYYFGRLFNYFYFVLLAYFSLKITPVGKEIFAAVSLLPMTIAVAATYSYDAGTNGLAFLLFALLLKAIYQTGPISRKTAISILLVTALLAPAKTIYGFISLASVLIPSDRFSNKKQSTFYKISVISVFIAVTAITSLYYLTAVSGTGSSTSPYVTLDYCVSHPTVVIAMFLRSLGFYSDFYISSTVISPFGWQQESLQVPWALVIGTLFFLYISVLPSTTDSTLPSIVHRLLFLVICLIIFSLVFLSMLTGWTIPGEIAIQGVQGRYFIPILPMLLFSLRPKSITYSGDSSLLVLRGMGYINCINTACVFASILMS